MATSPCESTAAGLAVSNRKWDNLPGEFKEVRLDKMDGKNLLAKVELLMAAVTPLSVN